MDRLAIIALMCLCAVVLGSRAGAAPGDLGEKQIRITWFGHAFFLVESKETRVAMDPVNESVGYPIPDVSADVLLVTHGHGDHNNVAAVKGGPTVVSGTGPHEAAGISFKGIATKHFDDPANARRGDNTIFVWQQSGITLAHCGDLGHPLTDAQVAEIGDVDVLMIPVGGHFTIDAQEARRVVHQLKPKVILPMHYRTEATSSRLPIVGVDDFVGLMKDEATVENDGKHSATLTADALPQDKPRVIVLAWK
ncbi:MAG: MBL fold metallo-hydrolase [Armatimonadota bacterium]|jgi:L-ascorbate metabolism protein UlaG (beta-lactamase superfamily)